MPAPSGPNYEFGPFRFDAGQKLLFRAGEAVPLPPKTLDLLSVLLEDRGRIVEKPDLMKRVWPDTFVEETGLARNVSQLRKALGDEADSGAYIETIPRRGYRFVAEVRLEGAEPPPVEAAPASAPAPPPRRFPWKWAALGAAFAGLAAMAWFQFYVPSPHLPAARATLGILPFEVLPSAAAGQELAAGWDALLNTQAAQIERLHVLSPGTVQRYLDQRVPVPVMSRLLRMDVRLEGSLQKLAGGWRVNVRLVDVHTGKVIWAETLDRAGGADAAIQKEVAAAIAEKVRTHLRLR